MKIGPKFKIAKRLGAPIFEKTQSQKFALSESRKSVSSSKRKPSQASDYKKQLIEKQKMRFSYGITEKQLRRYVDEALTTEQPMLSLIERLEQRLDNVVYRLGIAKTRRFARQMVSHGHITVNGRKMSVPSYKVALNDVISIREGSKQSVMFVNFADNQKDAKQPTWLSLDLKKIEGKVVALPVYVPTETMFDPEQVFEFYSR
jgi:small subunit ribosomal protein S4